MNAIHLWIALWALALGLLSGCGRASGPNRVDLSGEVSVDGKPVPAGKIYLDPDASKNNKGPQGFADIKEGRYDTRQSGKGAAGGPSRVRIEGFDGVATEQSPLGKLTFTYEGAADLPAASGSRDFPLKVADIKPAPKVIEAP